MYSKGLCKQLLVNAYGTSSMSRLIILYIKITHISYFFRKAKIWSPKDLREAENNLFAICSCNFVMELSTDVENQIILLSELNVVTKISITFTSNHLSGAVFR